MNYYFVSLLVVTTLYALWAGGGPERMGAAIYALSVAATHIVGALDQHQWADVNVGEFTIDVVTFIAFIVIALRANRFWPLWVSALLGLGVLGHLGRLAGPNIFWWAYAVSLTIWSYPILALIALGTFQHQRRLNRSGADRSWGNSSGRSVPDPSSGPTAS